MAGKLLRGIGAAGGAFVGSVRLLVPQGHSDGVRKGKVVDFRAEQALAAQALEAVYRDLVRLAEDLEAAGSSAEAAMVEAGSMIASDPGLGDSIEHYIASGADAREAIERAIEDSAGTIGALDDEHLAARADDVRSVGRRAVQRLTSGDDVGSPSRVSQGEVLLAHDLGPADVAEIAPSVGAIATVAGSVDGHAALVARALSVPMVMGLAASLEELQPGQTVLVDGDRGVVILDPGEEEIDAVRSRVDGEAHSDDEGGSAKPVVTADGRRLTLLVNAAGAEEIRRGLRAGAEGCGLLRTELAFLGARDWPSEEDHYGSLVDPLSQLPGRIATVRVLDFGGDKTPPFLVGNSKRGVALLVDHTDALRAQVSAVLRAGREAQLRLLVPLVTSEREIDLVSEVVASVARELDLPRPPIGAMIESEMAEIELASVIGRADFVSIGTNDLTHAVLGSDRFGGSSAPHHDPAVIAAMRRVVDAAKIGGRRVEVCGELAATTVGTSIVVGLGVDELSVAATSVREVMERLRAIDAGAAEVATGSALRARDAAEAERALDGGERAP